MAINFPSSVMQMLTPEVVTQIASFLGIDRTTVQRGAGGAVPAFLALLSDLVATPAGTSQLSRQLSQQPVGSPADLMRSIGAQGIAETGSNMLSALIGERTTDAMAQAVGRYANIGDSGGKSLLSMLCPMVLGALGQQQRNAGLDTNGLASLLRSQKAEITAAIPSALADQLGAAGLIDRAASTAGRTGTTASQTIYPRMSRTAAQWPYWLAAAVVLGGLAWYTIDRQQQQTVTELPTPTRPITGTVGMAPTDLTVDGVNLANKFSSSVDTLKATLPGMTDTATTQAALPKINEVTAQLNDISARAAKLSPEGRSSLAKLIIVVQPSINQMCDKVVATPGVGDMAKPTIDDLRAKLDALAKV